MAKKKTDFRADVKAALAEKKMSVPELARLIECNYNTIYTYLRGESSIRADLLERIFDELGVAVR